MPTDHPIATLPIPEEPSRPSTLKCSVCNGLIPPVVPPVTIEADEVPVFAPAGITLSQEVNAPSPPSGADEEGEEADRLCAECRRLESEFGGGRREERRVAGLGIVISGERNRGLSSDNVAFGAPMDLDSPQSSSRPLPATEIDQLVCQRAPSPSPAQPISQSISVTTPPFASTSQPISSFHATSTISCLPSADSTLVTDPTPSVVSTAATSISSIEAVIEPILARPLPPARPEHEKPAEVEVAPNPLLDIGRLRLPSRGRGCLYPGSVFRGSQTSGRSSYSVEVRILDISIPLSTLSGYLSISHLTDSHPHLTTFFSGEIIGPSYGFLTGPRYYAQATEGDDMRHWSRFEGFRKVKNELRRPGLTLPDPTAGGGSGLGGEERPFVFMRWKERFLVPDHKVRDISGASFAGFYYIQVDMDPSEEAYEASRLANATTTTITHSTRNTARRRDSSRAAEAMATPTSPPASPNPRRPSSSARRMSGVGLPRGALKKPEEERGCLLNGFYFHQANSEPFQELSLRHVPQRGSGSFELR